MRILFTSHYMLPHAGGIEVIIDQLSRALVARGHEVTHLASDSGDSPGQLPYRTIRVESANWFEAGSIPVPNIHPRLVPILQREIAHTDVVHAHGFLYASSATALILSRLRHRNGPARVLTEHVAHVAYPSRFVNGVEAVGIASLGRAVTRSAEAVVVYNSRVEDEMRRLEPSAAIQWIENGLDLRLFHPPESGEKERLRAELGWDSRPKVLFVGRLVAKKGIDLTLAAAESGSKEFDLIVVGPGDPPAYVPTNVTILGPRTPDQLARLYRAADAFLLPSRGEGFPLSVQEALASGLRAFVPDDPGYERYFRSIGPRLVRTPRDAAGIAAKIVAELRKVSTPEVPSGLVDWNESAQLHEQLYRELLSRRR